MHVLMIHFFHSYGAGFIGMAVAAAYVSRLLDFFYPMVLINFRSLYGGIYPAVPYHGVF